ncbi:hypothetical protein [Ulvibacter antarcticus]|uniref:DUF4149 domain-containing protein n=1 Tax=Ulvibacter antarcticus TaxID=442714 RepID=A0A3L9YB33_9FLAO|nr:hypothetical protein [Ulvibacter antarcticus]RMA56279.1 hypothetical protein BXY75_3400 [Ulvibacter antarcticus]
MIEISKKQLILLIGIGAFIFNSINGFTYLTKVMFRDLQVWFDQKPIYNFWITELSMILIFTLIGILVINKLTKKQLRSDKELMKIFILWIIAYFVIQLSQYFYTVYGTSFVMENKHIEYGNYVDFIREDYTLQSFQSIFIFTRYLIFAVIVYLGQKTVTNHV